MTWLVTGGAGYIGAHISRALLEAGHRVVVLDDLSTGREEFMQTGAGFVQASVLDRAAVAQALRDHEVTGVIHAAGMKFAGESVRFPEFAYRLNLLGTITVLEAMRETGVHRIVFSSSCAVYGTPAADAVDESTPLHPESPYARSKLAAEWAIQDEVAARRLAGAPELAHVSLRYFNVVGAGAPGVWDTSPYNLFPLVFTALAEGRAPKIFGDDYPTPDGTCIRDYIHVADIAEAHALAADALEAGAALPGVVNLGSGDGASVRQIMDAMRVGTGIDFEPEVVARRPGDPARIVARSRLATEVLGWHPTRSLAEAVTGAWAAHGGDRTEAG